MVVKATTDASDKLTRIPRYLQLASELREAVLSGKYSGRTFPTESILCKHFKVSRFTVREALRRLEAEGLITRRRGMGTIVQPPSAHGGALHQPLSNVGELLQYARGSAVIYRPFGEGPLPEIIVKQIAANTSGVWRSFRGVRQQDMGARPIAVTTVYFHERLGEVVDALDLDGSSSTLFGQIEKLAGIKVATVTQEIQAIAAEEPIDQELNVDKGSPILQILRCYLDAEGQIFEISVSHHPGDRFIYSMHIDI